MLKTGRGRRGRRRRRRRRRRRGGKTTEAEEADRRAVVEVGSEVDRNILNAGGERGRKAAAVRSAAKNCECLSMRSRRSGENAAGTQ